MEKDYLLRKDTALHKQKEFIELVEKINENQSFIQFLQNNISNLEEKLINCKNRKKIYLIISGVLLLLFGGYTLGFLALNSAVLSVLVLESVVVLVSSIIDKIKLSNINNKIGINSLKVIYLNRLNNDLKKEAERKYVQTIDSVELCTDYINTRELIEEENDISQFYDNMYEENKQIFDDYINLSKEKGKKAYFNFFGYNTPSVKVRK